MFVDDIFHHSQAATLEKAHVLALRLYTTAAFEVINVPLRDLGKREDAPAHRLPVTVAILKEAIDMLRAVNAPAATRASHSSSNGEPLRLDDTASGLPSTHRAVVRDKVQLKKRQAVAARLLHKDSQSSLSDAPSAVSPLSPLSPSSPRTLQVLPDLWRGMHGVAVDEDSEFIVQGGTDYAPMSTSTSIKVALSYSRLHEAKPSPVLLRLRNRDWTKDKPSEGWFNHGVDLAFLSCFPAEEERVYPPLTYLKPVSHRKAVQRIPVKISSPGCRSRHITVTIVSVEAG